MMRNSTRSRSPSPTRLHLHQLETRDTPAGTVNATFSAGVLTLTGDDDANIVQLNQTGTSITVVGTNTTITGGPTFINVTSVKALMKGGNDEITTNPVGPFAFTGPANFDLGDGSNTLGLAPVGQLILGSLTVKAGDGDDSISVSGTAGSHVIGNVALNLGAGDTDIHFSSLAINGLGGFKLNSTDGADSVNFFNVQLSKAATISTGRGPLDAVITGGALGSIALTGTGVNPTLPFDGVELALQGGTTVNGAIKVTSQTGARLDMTGVTATNVLVTGGSLGGVLVSASGAVTLTAGGITVHGRTAQLTVSPGVTVDATGDIALLATNMNTLFVSAGTLNAGGVRLTSSQAAGADGQANIFANAGATITLDRDIAMSGRFAQLAIQDSTVNARNATITGALASQVSLNGIASPLLSLTSALNVKGSQPAVQFSVGQIKVGGNLSISGSISGGVSADPGTILDVTGTLSIAAGAGDASLNFEGNQLSVGRDLTVQGQQSQMLNLDPFSTSTVGRNVTFTLGNDDDVLSINSKVAVTGNLTINAGAGNNSITVGTNGATFAVGANLVVTSLSGDDSVTLNSPQVTGTTKVTTGAGADLLDIRGPSTFTGATTIDLGAGDDTWNAANDPGTTSGFVTFTAPVNAKLGAGNDTLRLGLAGNLSTRVNFADLLANKIDGGTGLNLYDDEAGQVGGTVGIVNFTDPTP